MINGNTVLAVIPARGGSKGIPQKNIRKVGEKPLIAWTIEEARNSKYIDRVVLSSEDEEIIKVAQSLNCEVPFVRPPELAADETPGIEPILHAINTLPEKYDYVVMLQPTSPLRLAEDIDGCIEVCVGHNAPVCVSVTEPEKSPYWMYTLDTSDRLIPITGMGYTTSRRQDLPKAYALNGAVYVAETEWVSEHRTFLAPETVAFVMPADRSRDVDTEPDIEMCGVMLARRKKTCS